MPTYDYKCENCGHQFDVYQSMKDEKLTTCPNCGKNTLKRLIGTGGGLIFKGSGFYLTDYKNKPVETSSTGKVNSTETSATDKSKSSETSTNQETSTSKENSKTDSKNSSFDSKSDTKSEKKSSKAKNKES